MDEPTPAQLRNLAQSSWTHRRRLMYSVTLFSMACVAYCLYKDTSTAVHQTAVTMAFSTLISVTGSYVFGAVWDDKH